MFPYQRTYLPVAVQSSEFNLNFLFSRNLTLIHPAIDGIAGFWQNKCNFAS